MAKEKIAETDRTIKSGYKDDFNKTLPVFNLGDENSLKGNGGSMDEVLKKTSHIVDKFPRSKWSDDAWFLMGQSYFYRGDFFAAIETFEFVSTKYKNTKMAYNANLWTLYCYIFMDKQSESLAIINKLKGNKKFPKEYKRGLYLAAAEIAIRQEKPTIALENLNKALPLLKKKDEKIRYNYILAQLYESVDSFDKASSHYQKVIKYNPPYEFSFNSQINMAHALVSGEKKSYKRAKMVLKRMLKDDKNIEYYSKIYYELGRIENAGGNSANAINYYKISLRSNGSNNIIKTNSYNEIGDIYFDNGQFITSRNYYDSAKTFLTEDHPKYALLAKKGENQSELVKNLVTLQTNDSLLYLADHPDKLEKIIDNFLLEKERAKRLAEAQKKLQSNQPPPSLNNTNMGGFNVNNTHSPAVATSFPFYDITQRAKGYSDFIGTWGDRKLGDNWNVKSIAYASAIDPTNPNTNISGTDTVAKDPDLETPKNIEETRKEYYTNIPYTTEQKNTLKKENATALLNLGTIYIYDLNDTEKGRTSLENLLSKYPKSENEPRALYELAKLSKQNNNTSEYQKHFNLLEQKYPESNYLKVLKNELIADSDKEKNGVSKAVQEMYNQAFEAYQQKKYDNVFELKARHDSAFAGNPLQANFDYLVALSYGRKGDLKEYESRLNAIVSDYPNTSVASNASQNLFFLNAKASIKTDSNTDISTVFIDNKNLDHFTVWYMPTSVSSELLKSSLNDYHSREYSLKTIELTEVILGDYKCILVKGFNSIKENMDYRNVLIAKNILSDLNKKTENTIIHQQNLQIILKDGNFDSYLEYAKKQYK